MSGLKETIVGTSSIMCGILIKVISVLEKNLYWAITSGYYECNNIYYIYIPLIIIGLIFLIIGFRKKDI